MSLTDHGFLTVHYFLDALGLLELETLLELLLLVLGKFYLGDVVDGELLGSGLSAFLGSFSPVLPHLIIFFLSLLIFPLLLFLFECLWLISSLFSHLNFFSVSHLDHLLNFSLSLFSKFLIIFRSLGFILFFPQFFLGLFEQIFCH